MDKEVAIIRLAQNHKGSRNALPIKEALAVLASQGIVFNERKFRQLVIDIREKNQIPVLCMPKISAIDNHHGLCYATAEDLKVYLAYQTGHCITLLSRRRKVKEIMALEFSAQGKLL